MKKTALTGLWQVHFSWNGSLYAWSTQGTFDKRKFTAKRAINEAIRLWKEKPENGDVKFPSYWKAEEIYEHR
jgi:hypothetical protein